MDLYWLALPFLPRIGNQTWMKLLNHFGSPKEIFSVPAKELKFFGLHEETIKIIISGQWKKKAEALFKKIKNLGLEIITYNDDKYPKLLKEIFDPPLILYIKGNKDLLNTTCIAIVGTRRASFYGIKMATKLAIGLAESGITVVSGLARGIDAAAHKGALQAKGKTIAVLGCGLDVIYPKENEKLFNEIAEKGALISEFLPGTPPLAHNFPIRNRIISGLSLGVVVVEAALKSGSLITANLALEQGKEVFAVPGPIDESRKGTHNLLKQGAKLVEDVSDILEEFHFYSKTVTLNLDPLQEKILSLLDTPKTLEEIAIILNENITNLSATLTLLEVQGLIKQLPGKQYIKI
ncbi:MAG TPA: DNA-protecting protein DprA [Candidatus Desulfofervidus auxilii]|uniref:DNA-protecting protein DprA n=1 Tax=Desulfofervidus auxilii TaxID=1621989 RepID=A0A7C0U4G3_DESA2|nr:DNA-protecting protein DprA [Candidatus Desulfofervidus auxilii]